MKSDTPFAALIELPAKRTFVSLLPVSPEHERSFGHHLRSLRSELSVKQVSLSNNVGCSDAAISQWETGARLPRKRSLERLLSCLAQEGVPTSELRLLRERWHCGRLLRRGLSRAAAIALRGIET